MIVQKDDIDRVSSATGATSRGLQRARRTLSLRHPDWAVISVEQALRLWLFAGGEGDVSIFSSIAVLASAVPTRRPSPKVETAARNSERGGSKSPLSASA